MNLWVVGWGSGWHITPIASFLKYVDMYRKDEQQIKSIVWFGEANSMEFQAAQQAGVLFQAIYSGKIRRYWTLESFFLNGRDFFLQIYGFFQSLYFLRKHHIDVLFCKGGYVAFGVSCAAYILRIPIIVHESDTAGGLVNRIVAKMAKKVFSGFDHQGSETIGQLLSLDLFDYVRSSLKEELDIRHDPTTTTLLVMGWSQGSQLLMESILTQLDNNWPVVKYQIFLLWWSKNTAYKEKFDTFPNCKFYTFLSPKDLAYLYSLTDIAITRSSATSVAEQKLFGIRCVYIPLPFTWWNHQYWNAVEFCKQYPHDILLEQKDMKIVWFEETLSSFIGFKKEQKLLNLEQLLSSHVRLYDTIVSLFQ